MESKTLAGFGIGLGTGAIIGGVIALLYAPKSGNKTQEMLKSKAMETRDMAVEIADHVKGFATKTADKVKAATAKV
ncbi:MAG: YtxH domain-containing protein [Chloroflexota bacterium]